MKCANVFNYIDGSNIYSPSLYMQFGMRDKIMNIDKKQLYFYKWKSKEMMVKRKKNELKTTL